MLGAVCHFRRDQHLILEPTFLDWCKEQAPDDIKDELFVYRQLQVGTFVIGRWISKGAGTFVDLINLGSSLANFTREVAQGFRRRLYAPVTIEQTRRHLQDFDSNFRRMTREKDAYNQDYMHRTKILKQPQRQLKGTKIR